MLQRDYLMNLILQFVQGIRRSMEKGQRDPEDAAASLEEVVAQAMDMDASVLLGLQPESFASILQVSGTDPRVVEYIARSLALEAHYLDEAGSEGLAALRHGQAQALAAAYGIDASGMDEMPTEEELNELLEDEGIDSADLENESCL